MWNVFLVFVLACVGVASGRFAEWNKWSVCTSACSSGIQRRERLLPPAQGEYCHSSIIEQRGCSGTTCSRSTLISSGKPTTASSIIFNGKYPAKLAVDGRTSGRLSQGSCIHTEKEDNPWLRIDLTKSHVVQRVFLYNRQECCQDYLNNVFVTVGDDPSGRSNPVCARANDVDGMIKIEMTCASPLRGRYVHVRVPGHQFLILCEVQVYGQVNNEISRSKSVTMSPHDGSNVPSRAVDGNTGTLAVTKPKTKNPFLMVDLGSPQYISQVVVFGNATPYNKTTITVGNSRISSENVVCGTIDKTEKLRSAVVNCGIIVAGRYVTMTSNATAHQMTVAEFKAFGY